jgi:benzoyl-CoA reductase/2-hydroxyglutaryl-CoA dehydratase subunit BcrC/BadD/HgdB
MGSDILLKEYGISNPAVEEWKKSGKKILGTICCHVPEELIDAAGILPIRMRGTGCTEYSEAESWMSPFSCSFARAQLEYLINGSYDFLDGIVSSDGCLLAGRIADNWKYAGKEKVEKDDYLLFQFGAPRLYNKQSHQYYKEELQMLIDALSEFSGEKITDEKIKASVAKYNETRALIRELYALRLADNPVITGADTLKITLAGMTMPKEVFNKELRAFLDEAKTREPIKNARARFMLIGSALDDPEYLKIIEDRGSVIVCDVMCFGSRNLWEEVKLDDSDVLGSLGKFYLERPVCPRMIDIHEKMDKLYLDLIDEYKVDGVLYVRMKYCEVWGGESLLFEEKFKAKGVPFLTLEREEIMTNAGQLEVRAEAFIEMVEKEAK